VGINELNCRKKLNAAEFHDERFREEIQRESLTIAGYYLSALLAALHSIPDHALEDINRELSLGVPLDTSKFRKKIKNRIGRRDSNALLRHYWEVWQSMYHGFSLEERHEDVHRKSVELTELLIEAENENEEDYGTSNLFIADGRFSIDTSNQDIMQEVEGYFEWIEPLVEFTERFIPMAKEGKDEAIELEPFFKDDNDKWKFDLIREVVQKKENQEKGLSPGEM